MQLLLRRVQLCRIAFSRQADCADDDAALLFDPATQVRQRATLADEIVHYQILMPRVDLALETRLPGKASVPVGPGVGDHVGLHDRWAELKTQSLAEQFREGGRNMALTPSLS